MMWMLATAIVLAVLYLSYGVLFYGTRNSLSRLGADWNRWLFMLFIWTETLLVLPCMFDATVESMQWLVFFIGAGLALVGGASISSRHDEACHNAGAWVACIGSLIWLALVHPVALLIPLFSVIAGGCDRWRWSGEIGIIVSLFVSLL